MQNDERIPNLALKFKPDNIRPCFWPKKTVESRLNRVFCQYSTVFWTKNGSNATRFQLSGKIWSPLIILHLLCILILFSHFDFLTSHVIS